MYLLILLLFWWQQVVLAERSSYTVVGGDAFTDGLGRHVRRRPLPLGYPPERGVAVVRNMADMNT